MLPSRNLRVARKVNEERNRMDRDSWLGLLALILMLGVFGLWAVLA